MAKQQNRNMAKQQNKRKLLKDGKLIMNNKITTLQKYTQDKKQRNSKIGKQQDGKTNANLLKMTNLWKKQNSMAT